jgi:hypothetical protein
MKKLFFPLFVLVAVNVSAQKVSGKLSFQKGQKLEVVTNMNTSTEMAMGESSNNSVTTELYEVKDVAGANATLERSMKKMKMNISVMGQEKSIDSDNPEDLKGMLGDPIRDLLNAKNEFTVDANGRIVAVNAGEKKKKADNGMMGMFLQGMNLAGEIKEGTASFFKVLPDHEVGKGDTWNDTLSAAGTTMLTSYTLKDITPTEIVVDFNTDGNIDTKQDMMGMSVSVKGTIKSNGVIVLDKASGLPKQKTITTITDSAANLNGQEMNTKAKSTGVITVKPI